MPGLNYMQPLKWKMTYTFRVSEIFPNSRLQRDQESKLFPGIPAVGKGSYEVWFLGPREGEEVRGVKVVNTHPEPTKTASGTGKDSDLSFTYYNFTPDGYLPREISATITYEFVTFERYTFWEGVEATGVDKTTDLYKRYTKEGTPILFHDRLKRELDAMVKDMPEKDVKERAALCYNHLLKNFKFDNDQDDMVKYMGYQGVTDSRRAWENQHGVSDEIANVFASMLRGIGIPVRTVTGLVHDLSGEQPKFGGVHSWSEINYPGVGWVPVDATWGAETTKVPLLLSPMASRRELSYPDYYYGKSDPYRIPFFKDWHVTLQPKPKTPGAEPGEIWFQYHTYRRSGIRKVTSGFEPDDGLASGSGLGWLKSEANAEKNLIMELELLGPPTEDELEPLIKEIEAEGGHFRRVPYGIAKNYPLVTTK